MAPTTIECAACTYDINLLAKQRRSNIQLSSPKAGIITEENRSHRVRLHSMNRDYCIPSGNVMGCRCCSEQCLCDTKTSHRYYSWSSNPCHQWVASLFNPNETPFSSSNPTVGMHSLYRSYRRGDYPVTSGNHSEKQLSSREITKCDKFPIHARHTAQCKLPTIPVFMPSYIIIGHPTLKIYKFKLPSNLLHLLDFIVNSCNKHAGSLRSGWATYLYSLTKQDIAIRDIDGLYEVILLSCQ